MIGTRLVLSQTSGLVMTNDHLGISLMVRTNNRLGERLRSGLGTPLWGQLCNKLFLGGLYRLQMEFSIRLWHRLEGQ